MQPRPRAEGAAACAAMLDKHLDTNIDIVDYSSPCSTEPAVVAELPRTMQMKACTCQPEHNRNTCDLNSQLHLKMVHPCSAVDLIQILIPHCCIMPPNFVANRQSVSISLMSDHLM